IVKRLERLETKAFGKPSSSDDLSERVDRLKTRTGVDLAATPPPGSDWADDEEQGPMAGGGSSDLTYIPAQTTPYTPQRVPATNLGGPSPVGGGSGTYGDGSASATNPADIASSVDGYTRGGGHGYNPPRKIASATTPRTAPSGMPQPA